MNNPNREAPPAVNTIDMTDAVLYAGILPHSTNERDHAYELLDPKYTTYGAKAYIEGIATMQATLAAAALPREIWPGASLGFKSEGRKVEEARLKDETRKEIQEVLVDHMMDYTEDAKLTIDSLYALDMELEDVDSAEKFEIPDELDLYPELQRAVAALVRLYETRQYIAEGEPRKTRMNTDLLDDGSSKVQKRMAIAMHDVTVGEARRDLTEALRLEIGRLELWLDQLFGHPGKSAQVVELGEEGSFDEPTTRRRYGAIAINDDIAARISSRINTFDTYRE
ncbi:MAG: hypothetical protein JWN26_260 [Candidatus Saccharibacteria bacterium]|nr:hypothetical protein [Candidatus Saccharibacteria bacterium]